MAANSTVEIVNMAIVPLGARPIAALDEGSKAASLANEIFDTERDATLQAHEWNFAVKRTSLGLIAQAVVFGFGSQFQLPPDYLRVVEVSPEGKYKVEGRRILSNETALSIRYIAQITSPTEWSPTFKSVLAARLRWKMAYAITELTSVVDRCAREYEALLSEARTIDSQESGPELATSSDADVLISTRTTWGDGLAAGEWWRA